jgi:uncharacterized membrane protein
MAQFRELIEFAAMGIETLAVVLMVCFIIYGTLRSIFQYVKNEEGVYENYRVVLGRALLLGLELLVAADIIRTVALDLTIMNLVILGILVVVRTFLGWTLSVDIEGRWPWQGAKETGQGAKGETKKTVS